MNSIARDIKDKGFSHIKNAFSGGEISRLVSATDTVLSDPVYEYDFLRINNDKHIHKVRYMFEKDPVFLEMLVHNSIISILKEIITPMKMVVPTWEDMLIKVPFNGIPVGVHQDLALQSVKSDVFSLGIYLHDAVDNPVYYLPGSHNMGPLTRTEIRDVYKREKANFVPVLAKAGDIIVHNVKTVHFSDTNSSPKPRYTWYLEFRTMEQLKTDSPWDQEWANKRRIIWVSSLKKYARDTIGLLSGDNENLLDSKDNIDLRVPHVNQYVNYDMKSPYNHFSEEE